MRAVRFHITPYTVVDVNVRGLPTYILVVHIFPVARVERGLSFFFGFFFFFFFFTLFSICDTVQRCVIEKCIDTAGGRVPTCRYSLLAVVVGQLFGRVGFGEEGLVAMGLKYEEQQHICINSTVSKMAFTVIEKPDQLQIY